MAAMFPWQTIPLLCIFALLCWSSSMRVQLVGVVLVRFGEWHDRGQIDLGATGRSATAVTSFRRLPDGQLTP